MSDSSFEFLSVLTELEALSPQDREGRLSVLAGQGFTPEQIEELRKYLKHVGHGRYDLAEQYLKTAEPVIESFRLYRNGKERWDCDGCPHPRVVRLWKQWVELYTRWHRPEHALPYRAKLLRLGTRCRQ